MGSGGALVGERAQPALVLATLAVETLVVLGEVLVGLAQPGQLDQCVGQGQGQRLLGKTLKANKKIKDKVLGRTNTSA